MAAPALIMFFSKSEQKTIVVVDNTSRIAPLLQNNDEIKFVISTEAVDSLRSDESNDAILIIGDNAIESPDKGITLLSRSSIPMMTEAYINGELKQAIENVRLEQYNIPGIRQIIDEVNADVSISTIRIDKEEDQETSSALSYFMSLALDMLLYMFILIYGQMVMTSIIEEKNNRVLEIVVSSSRTFDLMLGKITGVGLVAVTQILIWGILIGAAVSIITPFLTSEAMGADVPQEVTAAIGQLLDPWMLIQLFVYIILFFIGGFLFYSSIYAAIGSAVSNIQDASQLSSIATMPIIIGIVASMAVMNDPDSTLSFWVSIIPFTSPMAMMARIPYGVPGWEIALSLALLYAAFIFMIWLCGKIYRVGIFMYGKKPSFVEIIKWARYK